MADNNCGNNTQKPDNCNMIPFVVYGYPMYGCMPGGMMPPQFTTPGMSGCGSYMNPMYYSPYNRPGCGCSVSDLEK